MTPNAFGTACKAGGARKALQALALFTATPSPSPPPADFHISPETRGRKFRAVARSQSVTKFHNNNVIYHQPSDIRVSELMRGVQQ